MRDDTVSADLLAWYDRTARIMPWRVGPADRRAGQRPDPYAVWLSEVMLQQTTVAAVGGYFRRFLARWPTVDALAAAEDAEVMAQWAGLGYYARARNLLACARAVVARGGFPDTRAGLIDLPGIGPYTAAAVAAIAFDRPETVVDGNVERVMARLYAVEAPLPGVKPALFALAGRLTPTERAGDHAQAVMDLGATICTPRRPACGICPVIDHCAGRAAGIAESLPRRQPRPERPDRTGCVFVGRSTDGAWLLESRPAKGLLGGMMGWPGSDWGTNPAPRDPRAPTPAKRASAATGPPVPADWRVLPGEVTHVFTHFRLSLTVAVARLAPGAAVPADGPHDLRLILAQTFDPARLPSLMRKVYLHAAAAAELN